MKKYFVHESSYIDDDVVIGRGTNIWHFCHVQSGARIGENCSFGQNVNISNNVRIGNGWRLGPGPGQKCLQPAGKRLAGLFLQGRPL